jgi:hypothetical protein
MRNLANENYDALVYYTLGLKDNFFIHQYVVDAYTAQFANINTKPISLIFSLVGLYLNIEKNYSGKSIQQFHTLMSNNKIIWPHVALPLKRGDITIDMILKEKEDEERNKMIKVWCISIWDAFADTHLIINEIAAYYLELKIGIANK